jgi:hypothetical protein
MHQASPASLTTAASVYSVVIATGKGGIQTYEVLDVKKGQRDKKELAADLIAAAYDLLKRCS